MARVLVGLVVGFFGAILGAVVAYVLLELIAEIENWSGLEQVAWTFVLLPIGLVVGFAVGAWASLRF